MGVEILLVFTEVYPLYNVVGIVLYNYDVGFHISQACSIQGF